MKPIHFAPVLCVAASLAAVFAPRADSSANALLGAGAVLESCRGLVRDLAGGDAQALRTRIHGTPKGLGMLWDGAEWVDAPRGSFLILDAQDRPVDLADPAAAVSSLLAWAASTDAPVEVASGWTDCHTERVGFAILELRRGEARYRLTALAAHVEGTWRFYHLHLSPAGAVI